jgi:hypothetical protein
MTKKRYPLLHKAKEKTEKEKQKQIGSIQNCNLTA